MSRSSCWSSLLLPARCGARVLAHLEARDGDAAGIGGLAGRVEEFRVLEDVHAFEVGRHVGAFRDRDAAVRDQRAGVLAEQLVLGRAGQSDVACRRPTGVLPAWKVAPLIFVGIFGDAAAAPGLVRLHPVDLLLGRCRRDRGRSPRCPRGSAPCRRAGRSSRPRGWRRCPSPRSPRVLPARSWPSRLQHVLEEIDRAIAGRLGADQRAAIFEALAGQHAR